MSKAVSPETLDETPGVVARVEEVYTGWNRFDPERLDAEDAFGVLEDLRVALYGA